MGRQAVCIFLVMLRVVSSQTAIDGCSGTADNCAAPHNYTVHWSAPIHLVCQGSRNVSQVYWSIDGVPVNITDTYTVYYAPDDPLHRFLIEQQPGSMGSDIDIWLKGFSIPTAVHNFKCSFTAPGGEQISTLYSICVVGNSADFLELQPDSSWTEDTIVYARPGSSLTLECSFYFGSAATPYNYSISWMKVADNETRSHGHNNDCSVAGDRIYGYNLTIVKAANVSEEEYVCEITKTSLWDPRKTSYKARRFVIRDMAQSLMEVIDKCQKCIFIMDSAFFDCRWCLTALQYAMKCHHKIIALVLMDESETQLHKEQIDPIAKVGVLINWRTENVKQSLLKRLFVPHYRWASLKLRLPPRPAHGSLLLKFVPDMLKWQSKA